MVTCARCGREAAEGAPFCDGCGAFLEWSATRPEAPVAPPPVAPAPSAPRRGTDDAAPSLKPVAATARLATVHVEPGAAATVAVEVRNLGRTVDQLSLEVAGPAAPWSTVEPARLNLMPGTVGTVTLTFRPPRSSGVRPGPNAADVIVRSHEHPDTPVAERIVVDVEPFRALEVSLVPRVLHAAGATTTRLLAANRGNVVVDLRLEGDDPAMALAFAFAPEAPRVEPGATATVLVTVEPRLPLEAGPERPRPFQVRVAVEDHPRLVLDGTLVQQPVPAPPPAPTPVERPPVPAAPPARGLWRRRRWPRLVALAALLATAAVAVVGLLPRPSAEAEPGVIVCLRSLAYEQGSRQGSGDDAASVPRGQIGFRLVNLGSAELTVTNVLVNPVGTWQGGGEGGLGTISIRVDRAVPAGGVAAIEALPFVADFAVADRFWIATPTSVFTWADRPGGSGRMLQCIPSGPSWACGEPSDEIALLEEPACQ